MALRLPAGRYEMTLFAQGGGSSSDSFYVTVDDGKKTAFHIPVGRFGPSSSAWTKDAPTPNIAVAQTGLHRITIQLREAPAPLLDRILLRTADGKTVADIQAESAPEVPADWRRPAPTLRFFVKNDGFARCKLTHRINHVGKRLTYLHERFGGPLQPGDRRTVHNLFFDDSANKPKRYDLRRINDEAALVLKDGQPFAVCAAGKEATLDGRLAPAEKNVVADGIREDKDFLSDESDMGPQDF
jgi:hypothetical protein